MIFNDVSYYLVFLLPSVALFHASTGARREWVLAAFGALFFVYYSQRYFGGWIPAACLGLFLLELVSSRLYTKASLFCIWGVVQAVAILFIFKYTNFAIETRNVIASSWGAPPASLVSGLFLPLGVSFFTFEFIHYAADVRAGKIEPAPLSRYAAFILFFPTMVAGPIKRYQDFDRKLTAAKLDRALVERGITRILVGLAKKHALADTFSVFSAQLNTSALYSAGRWQIVAWIFAYGGKIYFDFSGYSDIAIGSGYLFGIEVPENFDFPYARRSITDFWRHWHISLYKWIVDYLFIPLGGSRSGGFRTAINTLVAFAVSGLWHGAGANFLLWGLWHGTLLVGHRNWRRIRPVSLDNSRAWGVFSWALTFVSVNLGWAFFCMDARRALFALGRVLGVH